MEKPSSDITFQNGKILLRRGYVIDASDTSPENIYDIVKEHTSDIHDQITYLMETVDPRIEARRHVLRPTILIARLALAHETTEVLTKHALESPTAIYTHYDSLTDTYVPYWRMVAQTDFLPEVQEMSTPDSLSGVWLGVRER